MFKNWLGCVIFAALGLVVLAGTTQQAALGRGGFGGGGGGYGGGDGGYNRNNNNNNWRASTQKNANNNNNQDGGSVTPTTTPAEIADAENQLKLANEQLLQVAGKLKSAFEQSSAWTTAKAALDQAQTEYASAVKVALTNLKSTNSDYAGALQALADANAKLDAAHQADEPSPAAIAAAAQAVMDAKLKVTALEATVLVSDPAVTAAKTKVTTAGGVIDQVKAQFESTFKLNPDWVAAKQAVADAQARLDTLLGNPPPPAVAQQ